MKTKYSNKFIQKIKWFLLIKILHSFVHLLHFISKLERFFTFQSNFHSTTITWFFSDCYNHGIEKTTSPRLKPNRLDNTEKVKSICLKNQLKSIFILAGGSNTSISQKLIVCSQFTLFNEVSVVWHKIDKESIKTNQLKHRKATRWILNLK